LTSNAIEGTINDDTGGIDDLNDHGDLSLLLALVDLSNAANLDKTGEERRLHTFTHLRVSFSVHSLHFLSSLFFLP
jgi:hypothetical protein